MKETKYSGYFATEDGRIYSKKSNRFLKTWIYKKYHTTCVQLDGKNKTIAVHRIVMETFNPAPSPYHEVDHINRDSTDNRLENLRWVTKSENAFNKTKMYFGNIRTLTSEQQLEIIKHIKNKTMSQSKLAKKYNTSTTTINRIKQRIVD